MYAKLLASTLVCLSLESANAFEQAQSDMLASYQANGIRLEHSQFFTVDEPSGTGFVWQY